MAGLEVKGANSPDETRSFTEDKGGAAVVNIGGHAVLHVTYQPGWRWSEHVKPITGTDTCQANHLGYVLSGRMHIAMNDGTESEIGPGDFFAVPPGHDAWVLGDEACVSVDFGQVERFAKH